MIKRQRFKELLSPDQTLDQEAAHLRAQAAELPPGLEKDQIKREVRLVETAAHIDEWLSSPGLQAPQ